MLDILLKDKVTVRRAGARDVRNNITYTQLTDSKGHPTHVTCKLDKRRRRIFSTDGVEMESDATMVYRVQGNPIVMLEDLVYFDGTSYKIIAFAEQNMLFSAFNYVRADLQLTRDVQPEDREVGE